MQRRIPCKWRLCGEDHFFLSFSPFCSKDQQKADLPVSSQWCNPEQQEERTRVHQRLWVCTCWRLLTRCKVTVLTCVISCFYAARVILFLCCLMTSPFLDHTPSHSETDESCKKQMERLLNIWKERSLYRADYIQQLKLAIEDNNSPIQRGSGTENGSHTMIVKFLSKIFII